MHFRDKLQSSDRKLFWASPDSLPNTWYFYQSLRRLYVRVNVMDRRCTNNTEILRDSNRSLVLSSTWRGRPAPPVLKKKACRKLYRSINSSNNNGAYNFQQGRRYHEPLLSLLLRGIGRPVNEDGWRSATFLHHTKTKATYPRHSLGCCSAATNWSLQTSQELAGKTELREIRWFSNFGAHLIGPLECDWQMVRPIPFKVLPPRHFLWAFSQTDMWHRAKGLKKHSIWRSQLVVHFI